MKSDNFYILYVKILRNTVCIEGTKERHNKVQTDDGGIELILHVSKFMKPKQSFRCCMQGHVDTYTLEIMGIPRWNWFECTKCRPGKVISCGNTDLSSTPPLRIL